MRLLRFALLAWCASSCDVNRLAFSTQPAAAQAGVPLSPAVQVTVLNRGGAVVAGFDSTVTVALERNPGGALTATAGSTMPRVEPPVRVTAFDSLGNVATGYTGDVDIGDLVAESAAFNVGVP